MSIITTVSSPTNHERIEYYFELLRQKNRQCRNQYEAYLHLESSLFEIEYEHAPSLDEAMKIYPFKNFSFAKQFDVYLWVSKSHATVISCNGAYGIYWAQRFPDNVDFFQRNYFDAGHYRQQDPLLLFPSFSGASLW